MTPEDREKIKERIVKEREERHKRMLEHFRGMKPFEDVDDVPEIPIVDADTYNTIIIPNLIRCGAIPKDKLEIGAKYLGTCRNASEAVWDGNKFVYDRHKFGTIFEDRINHFQDDNGYDLFVPIKKIG